MSIFNYSEYAVKVQAFIDKLSHDDEEGWENALLNLIETYHVNVTSLDFAITIDDYLDQAKGFQSAYSFPSCNPPRSIIFCTTSLIQHSKCSWLQEVSSVYGIEPNIQCIREENLEKCMSHAKNNAADVVLVNQDERILAERDYQLKPILIEHSYEFSNQYAVLAVVKSASKIKQFKDLRGKKACFPNYEGAAYISVMETIRSLNLHETNCEYSAEINEFFSTESCTWEPNRKCHNSYKGDEGALNCLANGGDVAFVSAEVFNNFTQGNINTKWSNKLRNMSMEVLCPFGKQKTRLNSYCYLHWASRGLVMIHNETSIMRQKEIYNSLRDMDKLFGKALKPAVKPFTLYGPFDRKNNIIFQDATDGLIGFTELNKTRYGRHLEHGYKMYHKRSCQLTSTASSSSTQLGLLSFCIMSIYFKEIFRLIH